MSLNFEDLPFQSEKKNEYALYLEKVVKPRINKKNRDYLLVVTGHEGIGKTTFAAQNAEFLSEGKIRPDQICQDFNEFKKAYLNAKKGEWVMFDEAGTGLLSRESMKRENIDFVKIAMTSRFKNVGLIFCLPSFFYLDKYFREQRINLLVHIPKTGKFLVYGKKEIIHLSVYGIGRRRGKVDPLLRGYFRKQFPPRLEKEVRAREIAFKEKFIRDLIEQNTPTIQENDIGYYEVNHVARETGLHPATISKMAKEGRIKAKRLGVKWIFTKEAIEDFVIHHGKKHSSYCGN